MQADDERRHDRDRGRLAVQAIFVEAKNEIPRPASL